MAPSPFSSALLGAAVAAAAGAVVGVVAERKLVRERLHFDLEARQNLGSLRGEVRKVITPDATELHVEIDTPDNYDPAIHPTIIVAHGYALNQDTWHFQREVLRPKARLVFWDQRAHGRSGRGPSGSYTIDQLGHDLYTVLRATVTDENVLLIGHSMGGMTIMSFAASYPEVFKAQVKGVALLGTSAGGLSEVLLGLPAPVARLAHRLVPIVAPTLIDQRDFIERSRQRSSDLGALVLSRYSFGSEVPPEVADFSNDMVNATPADVVGEFLPTFDKHDKRAALETMAGIELLVMVGTADKMTPVAHSYEIIRRAPHAELVVLNDTGHMLMLERPVEVNTALLAWLERCQRTWQQAISP